MARLRGLINPAEMGASGQRRFGRRHLYPRPGQGERTAFRSKPRSEGWQRWQLNGTHFGCFAALSCLQYGPAKAGFRLKAGTTNFRTGVGSTEL